VFKLLEFAWFVGDSSIFVELNVLGFLSPKKVDFWFAGFFFGGDLVLHIHGPQNAPIQY